MSTLQSTVFGKKNRQSRRNNANMLQQRLWLQKQLVFLMDKITKEHIAQFLPSNPVIIEAGAHIGRDTRKMIRLWPDAIIHAFEPVPSLFQCLQKNVWTYNSIFCYSYALSDKTGVTDFYVSSGRSTATSSLLRPKKHLLEHPTTHFEKIRTQTITLDEWSKKYLVKKVDFMWLDMQGAELMALEAGTELLKSVKALLVEVALCERYENNPLYEKVKSWLYLQGFTVQKEEFKTAHWGNVFFIKVK